MMPLCTVQVSFTETNENENVPVHKGPLRLFVAEWANPYGHILKYSEKPSQNSGGYDNSEGGITY